PGPVMSRLAIVARSGWTGPLITVFFFSHPSTSQIYPLSLHDALPISPASAGQVNSGCRVTAARVAPVTTGRTGAIPVPPVPATGDRKSTRLNSSHVKISYAVFCLKKKKPVGAPPQEQLAGPVPACRSG